MINVSNLEKRSRFLVKAIADKAKYDNIDNPLYAYWALYLDDNRSKPREVDTCATSYCISVLETEKQRAISSGVSRKFIYHDIIQQAIRTLLRLRGENGAWPSVVEPKILQSPITKYSGEVAIGDNFFALTALIDVGFLTKEFEYNIDIPDELLTLDGRIEYVFKTIDWLLENKAKQDCEGWYYTNTIDSNISLSATISTTNILNIFSKINNSIKGMQKFYDYYSKISNEIKNILEFLAINIKADGGIDKYVASSNQTSSLLHTCKMVDALVLSSNPDYLDEIQNAISFIIATCKQNQFGDFNNMPVDFYSEQYNLVLPSEDEITIRHENFTEGVILYTLINILSQYNQSGSYVSKLSLKINEIQLIIEKTMLQLEAMQTKEGVCNGLFKCHVTRSDGMHPVYASFEGYRAIRLYHDLDKHVLSEDAKEELKRDILKMPFDSSVPYIFISYSHKNDGPVLKDVYQLKKQCNCWIDFENLDGGRTANEDDWTEKIKPILESPNCRGVILYMSKNGMDSSGLLREAEWILKTKKQFYTFLIDFSDSITPKEMADIVESIEDPNTQIKLRKKSAFAYVGYATADFAKATYHHRKENFSHLNDSDFINWINRVMK